MTSPYAAVKKNPGEPEGPSGKEKYLYEKSFMKMAKTFSSVLFYFAVNNFF